VVISSSAAAQERVRFDYVFVDEEDFERYKPDSFSDLVKSFRRYKDE
jgi:type III restriction enzyme